VRGFIPAKGAKITLLGKKGSLLKWKADGKDFKIAFPQTLSKVLPSGYAIVFKVSKVIQ